MMAREEEPEPANERQTEPCTTYPRTLTNTHGCQEIESNRSNLVDREENICPPLSRHGTARHATIFTLSVAGLMHPSAN